jgi:beta-phosphoglucomutase-like phosphatase (HAD superfamily)
VTGIDHDRIEKAADNAWAKWFTRYGLPAMVFVLIAMVGLVWNDQRAAMQELKDGQEAAARVAAQAAMEQSRVNQQAATEIQQTRADLTLLRAEITSGILWRVQKLEEGQEKLQRAVKTP